MIDRKWIGLELPESVLTIDRARLQHFAAVIGETNPIYTDATAARAAGYSDIPSPPTFLFAAELDSGAVDCLIENLMLPREKLLHGEQSFTYHKVVCAGDTVTVHSVVSDIYQRGGGSLEFVVRTSRLTDQHHHLVATLRAVLICRH
jgi:acyl dehydratase